MDNVLSKVYINKGAKKRMYSKKILIKTGVVILTFVFIIAGVCNSNKDIMTKEKKYTTTLFQDVQVDDIKEIKLREFDGTIKKCTEVTNIKKVLNILQSTHYIEIPRDEYVEGMYSFALVTEKENISIGISNNHLSVSGQQYASEKVLSDEILKLVK